MSLKDMFNRLHKPKDICIQCGTPVKVPRGMDVGISIQERKQSIVCEKCQAKYNKK